MSVQVADGQGGLTEVANKRHQIVDGQGNTYTQRKKLVIENATITDDSTHDATVVTPSGGTTLSGLTDVNFTNLTNGQIIQYDATTGKWKNVTSSATIQSIGDIADVDIATPTDGQALVYDATTQMWKNAVVSSPDFSFDTVAEMEEAIEDDEVPNGATIYVDQDSSEDGAYVPIDYEDFIDLPTAQQETGNWLVRNMPLLMNAYSLGYKNGISVGQKLDTLSADITSINSDLTELGTYSTGEIPVGKYGNDIIYRKIYNVPTFTANVTIDASFNSSYVKDVIRYSGSFVETVDGVSRMRSMPFYYDTTECIWPSIEGSRGLIIAGKVPNNITFTNIILIVEYTKR